MKYVRKAAVIEATYIEQDKCYVLTENNHVFHMKKEDFDKLYEPIETFQDKLDQITKDTKETTYKDK